LANARLYTCISARKNLCSVRLKPEQPQPQKPKEHKVITWFKSRKKPSLAQTIKNLFEIFFVDLPKNKKQKLTEQISEPEPSESGESSEEHAGLLAENEDEESEALYWDEDE